MRVAVVIPTLNEEKAIGRVISQIPNWVSTIIVVNNGSTDRTAERAIMAGAQVISENKKGYGYACMSGVLAAPDADVIVFLDGDNSDYPEQMDRLVAPIHDNEAELVIGSRFLGEMQPAAMLPHAWIANMFFSRLLQIFCGLNVTDIGPFRAISRKAFMNLELQEYTYGWTLEMMIKAAKHELPVVEVPVSYRRRIGQSKVSGSLIPSIKAGLLMFWTMRYCIKDA